MKLAFLGKVYSVVSVVVMDEGSRFVVFYRNESGEQRMVELSRAEYVRTVSIA